MNDIDNPRPRAIGILPRLLTGIVSRFESATCWQGYPEIRYYFTVLSWCRADLARREMGIGWPDPEWRRIEADLAEAAAHLGPWRRAVIERHVSRQLGYSPEAGQ